MTPRPDTSVRALILGCLLGLIGVLAAGLLVPAGAHALPPGGTAEPDDVFTAKIERVERDPGPEGRPTRYTYTVQVAEVFGDSDISSVRVQVQTTSSYGECATRPESKGANLYVWKLTRQGTRLVANGCRNVLRATEVRVAEAIETYGAARSPIETSPTVPSVEFPDVSYSCPVTSSAIDEVASAEETCDELAVPQSFDRAAAPGLALVIVGILGWIVVLRLGRSRRG